MAKATTKPQPAAPAGDARKAATRIQAAVLRAALGDVLAAVQSRNTIPVLGNVLIEVADGIITVSATDLDIWARRTSGTADRDGPASSDWVQSIKPFACTLPAKPLAAILAELDGEAMVTIEALERGDRVAVKAGRARFVLPSLPVADFPEPAPLQVEHGFEMPCGALADALAAVDYAVSTEETRYYLNGVFVHVPQSEGEPQHFVFAATDGHRLARLRVDVPAGAAALPGLILPSHAVDMLVRLARAAVKADGKDAGQVAAPVVQIVASSGGTSLSFTLPAAGDGEIVLHTKAIDGTFPDYVRVIPNAPEHCAVVERDRLAVAIKRVTALAQDKTRAVKLHFTADKIELTVTSLELGEASEELPCSYSGPETHVGFNGVYLRESLLAGGSEHVALHFSTPGDPMLMLASGAQIKDAAMVQVIMPMRV